MSSSDAIGTWERCSCTWANNFAVHLIYTIICGCLKPLRSYRTTTINHIRRIIITKLLYEDLRNCSAGNFQTKQ